MEMYAPGLPNKKTISDLPRSENADWSLNIQRHDADKAGLHYDIRLSPPGSNIAYSWATKKGMPSPGEKVSFFQQPDHTADYMGWSGVIEDGYGKGKVTSILSTKVKVLKSSADKIEFVLIDRNPPERIMLMRSPSAKEWLAYNYTPTKETKTYKDVPDYKYSYKAVNPDNVEFTSDKTEVWAPKYDGAHNLIVLRPDKRPDVFSYRTSKRNKTGLIDHTYKTNLYKTPSPTELGKTIIRAELYVPGDKGNKTSQILNSITQKALENPNQRNLKITAFDVVKYKGKKFEDKPYKEKLEALREISRLIPDIEMPELADTPERKEQLLKLIRKGQHLKTREGVVIYPLDGSRPKKVKIRPDFDGQIIGTFDSSPGSKYDGVGIGGFLVKPENSKVTLRVGTGLTDSQRKDAFANPDQYIGQWAQLQSQHKHKSGLHQAPAFKAIRSEKFINHG